MSENDRPGLTDIGENQISGVRLRDCVTVAIDDLAEVAVQEMIRNDRGAVIVVDPSGKIAGIFTERDVLELETRAMVKGGADWRRAPIREVMTPDPVVIERSGTIKEALEKMRTGGFRHLPVADPDGRPLGLVSARDILNHVVGYFESELQNLPPDPSLEAKSPWGA